MTTKQCPRYRSLKFLLDAKVFMRLCRNYKMARLLYSNEHGKATKENAANGRSFVVTYISKKVYKDQGRKYAT
jgi:hypothetical protein